MFGRNQLAGEVEDLLEEAGIATGQIVSPLKGITLWKGGVLAQPLFHVAAFALHEVGGQFPALGLARIGQIDGFEIRFEHAQQ